MGIDDGRLQFLWFFPTSGEVRFFGSTEGLRRTDNRYLRVMAQALDSLGYYGAPFQPHRDGSNEPQIGPDYASGVMDSFLYGRAYTIYGGSNEIQKNVIAKAVLGL